MAHDAGRQQRAYNLGRLIAEIGAKVGNDRDQSPFEVFRRA